MPDRFQKDRVIWLLLVITSVALYFSYSRNVSLPFMRSCACNTCLREWDPYFHELLKACPKYFLSRHTISEDVFDWWKHLQRERGNFTHYKTILKSLFQIFPSSSDVFRPNPGQCLTCAVVGNSGNLKNSHYGPLIDFHDVVMRMNRGRTKGFEADVGTKTTHHIFYPESARTLDNTTHLVFIPFKIADLKWLLRKFSSQKRSVPNSTMLANKDLVKILNPAFIKYVHEEWLEKMGHYPSTGFLTFMLSMQICDQVDVFGFGADRNGNWHHYFEEISKKKLRTGPHAGVHEYETIIKLDKKQKIKLFN